MPVLALLCACAPAGDGEITEPRAGGPDVAATQAKGVTSQAQGRNVVVLVLEAGQKSITVKSSARVERSKLGPEETWNGVGAATHRWVLVGAAGAVVAEGNIATRRAVHVPPAPGQPAAHADRDTYSFVVRAPEPGAGEHLEIHTLDGSAPVLSWP
jgi:hypothetical protein